MSLTLVFFLTLLSLTPLPGVSDPRATRAALICSTNNTASPLSRGAFIANFLAAMDAITPQISRNRFAVVRIAESSPSTAVYAFGECLRDLSNSDCDLCFAQIKTQILRCLPFQLATRGGRLFFDGCYIRYDDHDFFNETLGDRDAVVCSKDNATAGIRGAFGETAVALVRNLSAEAPARDGFFTGALSSSGNVTVYGLAQCWRFVRGSQCEECLAGSAQKVGPCLGAREARVLNSGCYLRYSNEKFYDNSTLTASSSQRNNGPLAIILAVTCAGFALLLTCAAIGFFLWKRVLKRRRERRQLGALLKTVNKSRLNFSYETLERATDYFNDSNKLGQGGSGSVYKGILLNGKAVAIKRLFFNTTQWVDHFFTEVNLISGIKHKNLVELLGCSITGPESLLVYEFVSNQCLHDNLFGAKKKIPLLSWESRFKIVLGTAEGLAFLHEESELRIIHRDIKLSNVLLDENLAPKIADFGLARLFPEDKTHISTGIAGTLGYMAPEYIVCGKLSEKADIYSFGVLLIEVVCGRKNSSLTQNSHSVLQMVWNLYGTGRLRDAVDPRLEGEFEPREVSRLLQIGLVCVQASAELRPSMSSIVKMIEESQEIPEPTQPPFLHSNSVEIGRDLRSREYRSQQEDSNTQSSANTITESLVVPR